MITQLRTLTKKSLFKFGKYHDILVGDVIIREPEYIIWVYYNMDKINLEPLIIKRLGITEIEKPGKLPWLGRDVYKQYKDTLSTKDIKRRVRQAKKEAQARLKELNTDKRFTRAGLGRHNHGHRNG